MSLLFPSATLASRHSLSIALPFALLASFIAHCQSICDNDAALQRPFAVVLFAMANPPDAATSLLRGAVVDQNPQVLA